MTVRARGGGGASPAVTRALLAAPHGCLPAALLARSLPRAGPHCASDRSSRGGEGRGGERRRKRGGGGLQGWQALVSTESILVVDHWWMHTAGKVAAALSLSHSFSISLARLLARLRWRRPVTACLPPLTAVRGSLCHLLAAADARSRVLAAAWGGPTFQ